MKANDKKTAFIIDDESHAIESLERLIIKNCPEIEIKGIFNSSKDGLLALKKSAPDLLFLDIEMPWMNGFELLDVIGNINFNVIFTTAHDKYAVQAFRISAMDYLLKPIDEDQLKEAVGRVLLKSLATRQESIDQLKHNMSSGVRHHRIGIPTKNSIDFVLVEDIIYCEADCNYAHIHLTNGKRIVMSKPLKELEQNLKPYNFCRIHQSYLINLNHLNKYIRGQAGYVIMDNGANLNVSRSRKEELLGRLGLS